MKLFIIAAAAIALCNQQSFGQGAQADQIKRRAKELSNQNNVRQGVAPPSQPVAQPAKPSPATPAVARPATPAVLTAQQGIARIQADIAAIKTGTPATSDQKTQFLKDIAAVARGAIKPSLPTAAKFVNGLTAALAEKALGAPEQARLAQDIEAVLNSAAMPLTQFDAVIADVQAILQVGEIKRAAATAVANDLKAVGQEVRRVAR